MILTNEQVRPLLRGAAEITEQNGHLMPLRFGKYVRESVFGEGNRFHGATLHASGAMLDFMTDSRHFALCYAVSPAGGHSFDTFVDGVMVQHAVCQKACGTLAVDLPEGESRVSIYLPHHAACELYDVTLDDGASFVPAPAPSCRILFVGDSITHGSTSAFASMTYPHQVARALDAEIFNQGISGAFFNPYAVDDELPDVDMVILAAGTNDWSQTTRGIFVGAVNGHFARLRDKYPTLPIVALLPLWRADHTRITAVGSFEDAREIIRDAAARYEIEIIDGLDLVPHVPSVFADARLHPNSFGFQFYAEELAKRLPEIRK